MAEGRNGPRSLEEAPWVGEVMGSPSGEITTKATASTGYHSIVVLLKVVSVRILWWMAPPLVGLGLATAAVWWGGQLNFGPTHGRSCCPPASAEGVPVGHP